MMSMNSPFKQNKKIKHRSLLNTKKRSGPLMALTVNVKIKDFKNVELKKTSLAQPPPPHFFS